MIVLDINIMVCNACYLSSSLFSFTKKKKKKKGEFLMVKVKFKSTVPCWLLCLEFLRSDCAPSSVMSAQVYCEAATSRAEMQE